MKLSVVIPVYNERKTLLQVLKKIDSVKIPNVQKELVIVDDKSTDGTTELLKQLQKKGHYKIVFHAKNGGKGTALRTGFKHASGDVIIIQDADLEYDPNDYRRLLQPIQNKETEIVFGSRFIHPDFKPAHRLFYIGNLFLSFVTQLLYLRMISDMETCYKVFTKHALSKIQLSAKGFEFEPEITAKFIKAGFIIKEVPVSYRGRSHEEGKKLRPIRDGLKALYYLTYYRFFD